MNARLLKFRFRWVETGAQHDTVIEAASFPLACYQLAKFHVEKWQGKIPADFSIDLSKAERVE